MMEPLEQLKTRWQALDEHKAMQFDAVQYAYIGSLLIRSEHARHADNNVFLQRVEGLMVVFFDRFEAWQTECAPDELGSESNGHDEHERGNSLLEALRNELTGSEARSAQSSHNSLDELLFNQELSAFEDSDASIPAKQSGSGEQLELQSMKNFRHTMKYFNVDRLIERALQECPQNPGPHNPQMLAIKSLRTMQTLSPQYLRRFAGYIETMLWLEKNSARLTDKK